MAYCGKCGAQMADAAKSCPSCGASVEQKNRAEGEKLHAKIQEFNNTTDTTAAFEDSDIAKNKGMAVLSYLGILVLIPLFACKDSRFARYHVNQGLVLCIAEILYGVAYSILSSIILAISWRLYFLVSIIGLIGLIFLVLAILGIVNVVNGRAKELPVIGKFSILK